jgi:fatty acid desaturase
MRDGVAALPGVVAAELGPVPAVEWPTLALAVAIYLGWAGFTLYHADLPGWLLFPALVWIVAWHGSLQHEVLHGHPTRLRRLNDALGVPPLALWLPYAIYRRSHLRHHVDARLTDPLDDPESFYWTPELWAPLSRAGKLVVRAQTTLLGRLLLGPAWSIGRFYYFQARAVWHGAGNSRRLWARHALAVAAVLAWLVGVCRFDPLLYLIGVVYPATALQLIRSFAEHRAVPAVRERSASVENAPVFGLLFLFNNLHAVHHAFPRLPWYRIPRLYRRHRAALVGGNGGLLYNGYADLAWRYLVRPHDTVMHPLERPAPETVTA